MLGINKGTCAAALLGLGCDVQGQCCFARDFPVHRFQPPGPCGTPPIPSAISSPREPVEIASISTALIVAKTHDRALAIGSLNLAQRGIQRLFAVFVIHTVLDDAKLCAAAHWSLPYSKGLRGRHMARTRVLKRQCTGFVLAVKFFFCSHFKTGAKPLKQAQTGSYHTRI